MDLEAFGDGAYRVVRRLAAQSHRQLVSFGNGEEGSAVEARLLGVPWVVWACVCLALAVLFAFLWPAEQGRAVGGAAYFVLRWGHALVWLLLSAAAFSAPLVARCPNWPCWLDCCTQRSWLCSSRARVRRRADPRHRGEPWRPQYPRRAGLSAPPTRGPQSLPALRLLATTYTPTTVPAQAGTAGWRAGLRRRPPAATS